ncbi:helix-turn-helix domain-containing protein [Cupriavidus basilensis]
MPRPLADATPPSRATVRTIDQLGDRIRATRVAEGMPIDQAARHCGVSVGMLSKLENGKGVNLEHALRALEGLGLTMLVVPKSYAPLLEQAVTHAAKASQQAAREDYTHMEEGDPQYF